MTDTLKCKLEQAAIRYDRRQSTRRGYNRYALGLYLARIEDICVKVEGGADPATAIRQGFLDRLRDVMLKAADLTPEPDPTDIAYEDSCAEICGR